MIISKGSKVFQPIKIIIIHKIKSPHKIRVSMKQSLQWGIKRRCGSGIGIDRYFNVTELLTKTVSIFCFTLCGEVRRTNPAVYVCEVADKLIRSYLCTVWHEMTFHNKTTAKRARCT